MVEKAKELGTFLTASLPDEKDKGYLSLRNDHLLDLYERLLPRDFRRWITPLVKEISLSVTSENIIVDEGKYILGDTVASVIHDRISYSQHIFRGNQYLVIYKRRTLDCYNILEVKKR